MSSKEGEHKHPNVLKRMRRWIHDHTQEKKKIFPSPNDALDAFEREYIKYNQRNDNIEINWAQNNLTMLMTLMHTLKNQGTDKEKQLATHMIDFMSRFESHEPATMNASVPDLYECSRRVQGHFPVFA